jgi:hypothetical protein
MRRSGGQLRNVGPSRSVKLTLTVEKVPPVSTAGAIVLAESALEGVTFDDEQQAYGLSRASAYELRAARPARVPPRRAVTTRQTMEMGRLLRR